MKDLELSLLTFSIMKAEDFIPELTRKVDVATIYKSKGEKYDLMNNRSIFLVTIFRCILMKLMYFDKYGAIDSSMGDSQVGERKGENVINHIWVLNIIICEILSTKKKTPIDIQIVK